MLADRAVVGAGPTINTEVEVEADILETDTRNPLPTSIGGRVGNHF